MSLGAYSGATGMENEQLNLEIIANNLANVNTPGYKEVKGEFADLLYHKIRTVGSDTGAGEASPTGIEVGNGAQLVSTAKIFTQGKVRETGGETDLAIVGDGFFEVTRADGSAAYTRAGDLHINSQGQFTTSTGFVLGSGFQAVTTGSKVAISDNGTVSVETPDGAVTSFRIQLTRFANPGGLSNLGSNLLKETPASGSPETGNPGENGFGTVKQGHLELSNVETVRSMVQMIISQRAFEMNSQSIKAADETERTIAHLK